LGPHHVKIGFSRLDIGMCKYMARQPSPFAERSRCLCRTNTLMLESPFVLQIFLFVIHWDILLGFASTHPFPFSG
jgi:hypothetical protein